MAAGRPEVLWPLFSDLTGLPGVGPKTAKLYEKLGVTRPRDLIFTAPQNVIDRRLKPTIAGAAVGEIATVEVLVETHFPPSGKGRPYRVTVRDEGAEFLLTFFHAREDWVRRSLPTGQRRIVSGKVEIFDGVLQMTHPDHVMTAAEAESLPPFEPVYPLTAGLGARAMRKAVEEAAALTPDLPEWLDSAFKAQRDWPDWRGAIAALHAPQGGRTSSAARRGRGSPMMSSWRIN